jgi:type III secretion protein S
VIAFLQAATQIQEQTFQYAAKLLVIVLSIFLTASMLGGTLYQFGERVFDAIPEVGG